MLKIIDNSKTPAPTERGTRLASSQFTMGVDAADANNDGYPEIISMDMLTPDPDMLKRSLGGDAYDIFNLKIKYGYNYQYSRNNLQYNRQNGSFSEIGLYSGIAATDWSWSSGIRPFAIGIAR